MALQTSHANQVELLKNMDDNIVISGIACRLPLSDNMDEFKDNLMNSVDMVTEGGTRWEPGLHGLPSRSGRIKDLSVFDAEFFGVPPIQVNSMDPQLRLLLEVAYEAILDSGVDPVDIRGSRTGVFIGASSSESHSLWSRDLNKTVGYTMTGCTRNMLSNRLSFFFDFKGPSYSIDTACSSSLLALNQALNSMRLGECDAALVGGCHTCIDPAASLQFLKLGMLSPEGKCKSFSASSNGYCRSEGIVVIYLQKETVSKRVYCTVVHSKTNNDGNKTEGILSPSKEAQMSLLHEVYSEAKVNPIDVQYIEAHGTGTKVGDLNEVNTICDFFCNNRQEPLPIGSVKSNIGHCEPTSGLAAVAKVVIAMQEGTIPSNLHYENPNPDIPGLQNGKLSVVSHNRSWNGGLVGVNSFGFGGSNVHVILSSKPICLQNDTKDKRKRLFTYSSRTNEGLLETLQNIRLHQDNLHFHTLMNETALVSQSLHPYRGFIIMNGTESVNVQKISEDVVRPVWYVFAGMGSQWYGMGRNMMGIHVFKDSILKSERALSHVNLNLYQLLMNGDENSLNDIVNAFVAIVAIQIALVDVLTRVGVKPDGMVGHSIGELVCAYADGCLSAEETIQVAYWRGQCVQNANIPHGGMAAVGLTWQDALEQCPPKVVPACHNAKDTVTVSGPYQAVEQFVNELKGRQIFAKMVNSAGVPFHSYHMKQVAKPLQIALSKIIKRPRKRSKRWLSTSVAECDWQNDLALYSSSEYFVNNLLSPVLFQEALVHVPDNAIVIEIAPHCLLQAILKRSLSQQCSNVGLMKRGHTDNEEFFLSGLGRCFQYGVNINPLKLCPQVNFPVSVGTPFVSPWIKWNHSQSWNVPSSQMVQADGTSRWVCGFDIDLSTDSDDNYLTDHIIDGRALFPAAAYLLLAWKALAKLQHCRYDQFPVQFTDVEIIRPMVLPANGLVHFDVSITPGTNDCQILECDTVAAKLKVAFTEPLARTNPYTQEEVDATEYNLTKKDVYQELALRGYNYGPYFQKILQADETGYHGILDWHGDWVPFLDTMLQMILLSIKRSGLVLPVRIRSVTIDPVRHVQSLKTFEGERQGFFVNVDKYGDLCTAGFVQIMGAMTVNAPRRQTQQPTVEMSTFMPVRAELDLAGRDELKAYAKVCSDSADECLRIMSTDTGIKPEVKQIQAVVGSFAQRQKEDKTQHEFEGKHHGLLQLLRSVTNEACNGSPSKADVVPERLASLSNDVLLNVLYEHENLQPCLELVAENTTDGRIRVLVVSDVGFIDNIWSCSANNSFQIEKAILATTNAAPSGVSKDNGQLETISWSLESPPPTTLQKVNLAIADNVLHKQHDLKKGLRNLSDCVEDGGFVLIKQVTDNFQIVLPLEVPEYESSRLSELCHSLEGLEKVAAECGLVICHARSDSLLSSMILLRRVSKCVLEQQTVVDVTNLSCSWVDELKLKLAECHSKAQGENVWLVAQESMTGILGLVKCLRLEPGGERIRCIWNCSETPMNVTESIKAVLGTDLVMNVYKDGQWGSYRHLPLLPSPLKERKCAFVNVQTPGDLSSLEWIESPLAQCSPDDVQDKDICVVHYSSLNFRDIMLATGRLSPDAIPGDFDSKTSLLGIEISGVDSKGNRVMGIVSSMGIATSVQARKDFLWEVPSNWTLAEAATVPVAYCTAYYALVVRGNIRHGDKVLIHSGSGSVGQAAISVALHFGCEVFTTVGSEFKKEYLMARYPSLHERNILSSKDTSFELNILHATCGYGVDVVLNSLSEEKLLASLQVLARHGRFLEIGKYDMSNNTALGMSVFLKNISFHGILIDALFDKKNNDWKSTSRCFIEGIRSEVVRPFQSVSFERSEIESAFRFMAQGKHVGKKVIVKIRDTCNPAENISVPALARISFDSKKSYVITGGLGGFGLELAQWLAERGAKYLVLTSRSGVKTGYQKRKLNHLQGLGVEIKVSTRDVCIEDDARALVKETNGRHVGGIFHLVMTLMRELLQELSHLGLHYLQTLHDALFENLDRDIFLKVCNAKVNGTVNMDKATRELCIQNCDWFVAFSSFVCERGNPGQSNYAFANSFMERVCENRRRDGIHGLAIQWGVVGDVGIVVETTGRNDTVIRDIQPQSISSCLATLDKLMNQSEPVVASYVPARREKASSSEPSKADIVEAVCNILGIVDRDQVNQDASFDTLGLDSLMVVELKQVLEKTFNISLTSNDIRKLTMKTLDETVSSRNCKKNESNLVEDAHVNHGQHRETEGVTPELHAGPRN